MCQFLSAIVLKDQILFDYWDDSHENILQKNNIKDDSINPQFVRVELLNKNNDIFDRDQENWNIKIDQDFIPDWFDKDKTQIKMRNVLKKVHVKVFLINDNIDKLNTNIRYCKNTKINIMLGSSSVGEMWDSSSVGKMWDSSSVGEMWGSSSVGKMLDSSSVGKMLGSSSVGKMLDSSSVKIYSKYSKIERQKNNSVIIDFTNKKPEIIIAHKNWNISYR